RLYLETCAVALDCPSDTDVGVRALLMVANQYQKAHLMAFLSSPSHGRQDRNRVGIAQARSDPIWDWITGSHGSKGSLADPGSASLQNDDLPWALAAPLKPLSKRTKGSYKKKKRNKNKKKKKKKKWKKNKRRRPAAVVGAADLGGKGFFLLSSSWKAENREKGGCELEKHSRSLDRLCCKGDPPGIAPNRAGSSPNRAGSTRDRPTMPDKGSIRRANSKFEV
ncbi:hypothetical protein Taro_027726, partial [Colocasia esculenta]|nr:hypothetical protein [Colocasia esculenta]